MSASPRGGVIFAWAIALHVPAFVVLHTLLHPELPLAIALSLAVYLHSLPAAHVVEAITRPGHA